MMKAVRENVKGGGLNARLIPVSIHTMIYSKNKNLIECILFCFCHV